MRTRRCRIALASVVVATTLVFAPSEAVRRAAASTLLVEPPVEYTVLLNAPQTQMIDVSITFRGVPEEPFDVAMPAWRPGRYTILDLAGAVRAVSATSGAGKPLAVEKTDKSTWRIAGAGAAGDDEVVVNYRVYASALGDRTRHADASHAFISPAAVLMYAPTHRDKPARVRIVPPEPATGETDAARWDIATGLDHDPADPTTFLAPNYDVLVDSPLEIGRHERLTFDVAGVPHELVIWNESGLPRTLPADRITGDITKLAKAERDVFGSFPTSRYVFITHAYPDGHGGTEHLNSCVMQTSPASFRDEEALKRFLGLVSHEYFHTWNVKQLRPAGLKPYDYTKENYTDLLWVAEGTTSYLDGVCLVRAGLSKADDELKRLGDGIDGMRRRPGASVQSLHDSSFDAWIDKSTPNSVNSSVSFYDKGSLVSFLLDMELRKRTGGKAGLDAVLRDLYTRFPLSGPGYTTPDLISSCERTDGGSFARFFADYVNGTVPLDFESVVGAVGLQLRQEPPSSDHAVKADGGQPIAYLGFTVESRDGLAAVASVLADGPAYSAGLLAGDLIVAMNGTRLRSADLDARAKQFKPDDAVTLSLLRYDRLIEITFKAAARPAGKWALTRVKEPTEAQRSAYESWLGDHWPTPGVDGKKE